jgi:hypothetical protein
MISSPVRKAATLADSAKPRGTIARLLDRMTEIRLQRDVERLLRYERKSGGTDKSGNIDERAPRQG